MRVGVTGHRHLADPDAVGDEVDRWLDRAVGPDTDLVVVSALAEGADRLVAVRALARPGTRLEAILPLAADQYREDFTEPESLAEFDRLLQRARSVAVAPVPAAGAGSREAAYEAVGHAVVDACDVLLALWDGGPSRGRGGTAEIVARARSLGRTVVHVPTMRRA